MLDWYDHRAQLADAALQLRTERRSELVALFKAGEVDQANAADQVRILSAIAADWQAIAACEPAPPFTNDPNNGGAYRWEREAVLADLTLVARDRAAAALHDVELQNRLLLIETLAACEHANPTPRMCVDTTLEISARIAASLLKKAA